MTETLTIPAFNNQAPFNEMLLQGILSAKSRWMWTWNHTGPTLLRTSTKMTADNWALAERVDIDLNDVPRGAIVGIGNLLPVRRMTAQERKELSAEMRPFTAGTHRFDFIDLVRFPEPVFWSRPGAVNVVREFPAEVEESIRHQIEAVGFQISELTSA